MDSNNKKRLLKLIEILMLNSDFNHRLSLSDIMELLENEGIHISNRKTLYDDLKVLEEFGYNVEYISNGYYLNEAPFTISEIKVISDCVHSLKNIDSSVSEKIDEKLYRYISKYEKKQLQDLEFKDHHTDEHFLNRVEDVLYAIDNRLMLVITGKNKKESEIGPCFMYRENNYYYLYYHYAGNDRIYKTRFDNIHSLKISDRKDDIDISKDKIFSYIEEGVNAYNKGKAQLVKFEIVNPSKQLNGYLKDSFNNIIFTKNGFSIRSSVNDVFFSKLTAFNDDIKISNRDIADQYIEFLNRIIIRNK